MSNYDSWSAEELERTVNRLQHMVGAQTMMIEELRESLSSQVDLIESLESDRDAWKAKESKCAASYYGLAGEYQELQNQYAVQSEKLKHAEVSRDFYIDCHSNQTETIARLRKELDETSARAENESESRDKLYNQLAELKVAYASSGELGKDREIEALSAKLRALEARYSILKDDNNRMHEALDTIHELSE